MLWASKSEITAVTGNGSSSWQVGSFRQPYVDAVLPAASVQEIGFIRGLSSMLYGPNVLGGIVEAIGGPDAVHRRRPGDLRVRTVVGHDDVARAADQDLPLATCDAA